MAISLSGITGTPTEGSNRIYFGDGCPEPSEPQWKVGTATLAEAKQLCDEANAKLAVIFITRKFRVYRDHVELEPGSLAAELTVNEVPERLAAWCAGQVAQASPCEVWLRSVKIPPFPCYEWRSYRFVLREEQ